MSEECDHNAIHCECGHQQDIEEAVIAERKRIIALARLRGKEGEFPYGEELEWFARELEVEDGV